MADGRIEAYGPVMSASARSLVLGPLDGERLRGPVGGALRFLARSEQTAGALTALENVVPAGQGPPRHIHDAQDESWWVLEGAVRFVLDDRSATASEGTFVWVGRGVEHAFRNDGPDAARLLVLFTPGGVEPFFDGLAALPAVGPGDMARLGAAIGMTVTGPPLEPVDA